MPQKLDTSAAKTMPVVFSTSRITRIILAFCVVCELLLVYLDYRVNFSYGTEINSIRRLFNITREDALASWFGSTLFFMTALTGWLICCLSSARPRRIRAGWIIVASLLTYLAVDDGAEIHERVGTAFEKIQEQAQVNGEEPTLARRWQKIFPSYEWQLLFMPAFGVLGVFSIVFLMTQMRGGPRILVPVAFFLLAVAVGLDFIEGLSDSHPWNLYASLNDRYDIDPYTVPHFREVGLETIRHFSKSLEEFIEMLAVTLLWVAMIRHAARAAAGQTIKLEP